ncbi:hypothetical protein HDU97_006389 [Phlyctochytrium planicorne]|nr:hypothetical protein HDU97_006389 [Phlyctochytrium planicorne]
MPSIRDHGRGRKGNDFPKGFREEYNDDVRKPHQATSNPRINSSKNSKSPAKGSKHLNEPIERLDIETTPTTPSLPATLSAAASSATAFPSEVASAKSKDHKDIPYANELGHSVKTGGSSSSSSAEEDELVNDFLDALPPPHYMDGYGVDEEVDGWNFDDYEHLENGGGPLHDEGSHDYFPEDDIETPAVHGPLVHGAPLRPETHNVFDSHSTSDRHTQDHDRLDQFKETKTSGKKAVAANGANEIPSVSLSSILSATPSTSTFLLDPSATATVVPNISFNSDSVTISKKALFASFGVLGAAIILLSLLTACILCCRARSRYQKKMEQRKWFNEGVASASSGKRGWVSKPNSRTSFMAPSRPGFPASFDERVYHELDDNEEIVDFNGDNEHRVSAQQ